MKNQFGLSRYIPAEIKLAVRKNSGFGCVICGMGIINYEHVDPEFHAAQTHDSSKMTLLCYSCHGKVTKGIWSKEKVKEAMKNPKALQQKYSNDFFDLGTTSPIIIFAGSRIENCPVPIAIDGIPLFEIRPPEGDDGKFLLSAEFRNSEGTGNLIIKDNEWFSNSENWDVEIIGSTLKIRENQEKVSLQITAKPPEALVVDYIEMNIKSKKIVGDKDKFILFHPTGGSTIYGGNIIKNCSVGYSL